MHAAAFSAAEVRWQEDARCDRARFDFTPRTETPEGLEYARRWCDPCPVRAECLAYALLYRMPGYWGGTDTAERHRLAVPRNRVKCPVCKSRAKIATPEGHEICQHCGLSWTGGPRPCLPEETASCP